MVKIYVLKRMDSVNKRFVDLDLMQKIRVKKAIIRRAEHDPKKNMDHYAFEFMSIDRDQEKRLNKFIFDLQRLLLKKK